MSSPSNATAASAGRTGSPSAAVRLRYAGSGLQKFLSWWGGELLGLLPARWRALFAQARARVLYVVAGEAIELRLEDDGSERLYTAVPLEAGADMRARVDAKLGPNRVERPRWLLLPGGQVLRRKIALPLSATERLREVVGFELDRQTPFRADQVAYDCRVLGVDPATKMAQVEMLVLPKDRLEAALAPLGTLATQLSGVDARDAEGRPLRCNLLPPERRQQRDHRTLWINLVLSLVALVAIGFALNQILDNRLKAVADLEEQVKSREVEADAVKALSRQLVEASSGSNFLSNKRASEPPMLAVLADVTSRIPDNTFLERFSEQEGSIYLTGLSTDAAGLVARLQSSPLLRSPSLSGSLQPDPAAKRDRFTLAAELRNTAASPAANGDKRAASPP